MSTQPVTLSPEQLFTLENELQEFGNPTLDSQYARFVYDMGDSKGACRLDDCGRFFVKHRDENGHVFTITTYCMRPDCPACANRRADEMYEKYSVLSSTLPNSFTSIEIDYEVASKARKILSKFKLGKFAIPLLANTGCPQGYFVDKMLLSATIQSLPDKLVQKLRALDPQVEFRAHDKSEFQRVLKWVVAPHIPPDYDKRLKLAKIKRRLHFQGMSQDDRRKLFVQEQEPPTNNFTEVDMDLAPTPHVPHCPKCGKPSIQHTQRLTHGVPLHEELWVDT